jgi:hypothetical protein
MFLIRNGSVSFSAPEITRQEVTRLAIPEHLPSESKRIKLCVRKASAITGWGTQVIRWTTSYDMVKDNALLRKKKAEECGIGFELPTSVSSVVSCTECTEKTAEIGPSKILVSC